MISRILFGVAVSLICATAVAQTPTNTVKIGVLSDFSGVFSAWGGQGSVVATDMAIEDFRKANPGFPYQIQVVQGDFQLKPDLAVAITKKWMDEGVSAIVDVPISAAALAVADQVKGTKVAALMSGPAANDLVVKHCSPNMVHWTYDQYSLGSQTAKTMIERGGKSWFFITQDSVGGLALENGARPLISAAGGKILGSIKNPVGQSDFSSQLLQAQASNADVIAINQGGSDTVNAVKQAREFGIKGNGQKLVLTWAQLTDIKGMGLGIAQGLVFSEAFYWDTNDSTRAFSKRFAARYDGRMPTAVQAGAYSVVLHYLKGVAAAKSSEAPAVIAAMKSIPVSDDAFGHGVLRDDGRMVHDVLVVQVKEPGMSKGSWDLYKVLKVVPGKDAFRPASRECSLVH
ncbi:ABC transporter substrate-binding protein [Paraburkholderia strydomiana]|uniref:ABC transporter substrate-binding protein n=1 Tax=Paraburkholderia strydomiana TaxID=1245417 RepID=UPI0038B9E76D